VSQRAATHDRGERLTPGARTRDAAAVAFAMR